MLLLTCGCVSVLFWQVVRLSGSSGVARMIAAAAFVSIAALVGWSMLRRRFADACCALAYLAAVEPAFRAYAKWLPYLSLEYVIVLCAGLVLLQRRAPLRLPTIFLGLYLVIEIAGMAATANQEDGRWMVVMTAARLGLFLIFARAHLHTKSTLRVLSVYVSGTIAMASLALSGALGADVQWTTQSNYTAAGGMGPNQIAGLLALGAFAAMFLADVDRRPGPRLFYLALTGTQVLAALLTFTRGGSAILVLGIVFYVSVLLLSGRVSVAVAGAAIVLLAAAWFAVGFTDQLLLERYRDTELSGRESIWRLGLRIFWDNPLVGAGTGNFYEASQGRLAAYHGRVGSHNELIRALAEHGIVGASVWIAFVLSALAQCWRDFRGLARAATMSWLLMAVAFECHSGLKLSMSMFFMALAVEGFRRHASVSVRQVRPSRSRAGSGHIGVPLRSREQPV
jgi:O-antigen ligase